MLWQMVDVLEAQEALVAMEVSDFAWAKAETRQELHRKYHKIAYPKTHDPTEVLTTEQLAATLKAVMSG